MFIKRVSVVKLLKLKYNKCCELWALDVLISVNQLCNKTLNI